MKRRMLRAATAPWMAVPASAQQPITAIRTAGPASNSHDVHDFGETGEVGSVAGIER